MLPSFREGLPDCDSLSSEFGFCVPEAFVSVIRALYEHRGGDSRKCSECFAEATGYYLAGEDARYQQTPPELFPVGAMGVDGVHLGYVVHAPELEASDYPIGTICPMDPDGVILVGRDTREALENLMSSELSYEPRESECIRLLSDVLGVHPKAEKAKRRYGSDGSGLRIQPTVPRGWKYLPSSDGIGVLASGDAFGRGRIRPLSRRESADSYLHKAKRSLKKDHPATALYYLREGYWKFWPQRGVVAALSALLIEVYHALGRPSLAEVAKRRAGSFGDRLL